uniref:Uncharacterized protein n=1 Tax=Neolamprologus brichardi TaxID=32507 RepID=A0A3Q4N463_NEOBR
VLESTMRRVLNNSGMYTAAHLQFAKDHVDKSEGCLNSVFGLNEKHYFPRKERITFLKHGGGSVMVWAWVKMQQLRDKT